MHECSADSIYIYFKIYSSLYKTFTAFFSLHNTNIFSIKVTALKERISHVKDITSENLKLDGIIMNVLFINFPLCIKKLKFKIFVLISLLIFTVSI